MSLQLNSLFHYSYFPIPQHSQKKNPPPHKIILTLQPFIIIEMFFYIMGLTGFDSKEVVL